LASFTSTSNNGTKQRTRLKDLTTYLVVAAPPLIRDVGLAIVGDLGEISIFSLFFLLCFLHLKKVAKNLS
jgi:hypothetical protein